MRAVRPDSVISVTTVSLQAGAHIGLDCPKRRIECAEQLRQPAVDHPLVIAGVPAVKRERADTRTVRVRQVLRGSAGSFGE